jgi:hypothetical protein
MKIIYITKGVLYTETTEIYNNIYEISSRNERANRRGIYNNIYEMRPRNEYANRYNIQLEITSPTHEDSQLETNSPTHEDSQLETNSPTHEDSRLNPVSELLIDWMSGLVFGKKHFKPVFTVSDEPCDDEDMEQCVICVTNKVKIRNTKCSHKYCCYCYSKIECCAFCRGCLCNCVVIKDPETKVE